MKMRKTNRRFAGRLPVFLLAMVCLLGAMLPVQAEENYSQAFDKFVVSAGECVNVRKEPKLDSEIIAEIYPGQVLECTQVVAGEQEKETGTDLWYEVSLGEGTLGYTKYDYFLHGEALQDWLLRTERIYGDIKADTEAWIYPTSERKYGEAQTGPTGELYNVLCVWDGLLELDGLGFVGGAGCELTLISEEEKADREAALLAEDMPEMAAQLAIDRAEQPAQPLYSAVVPQTSALRAAIVAEAQSHAGLAYVWGGTSLEKGADCSGFVMRIYEQFGMSIGRTTRQQAANGTVVDISQVQPGDLVFYADAQGVICHVVMYVGDGMCVHARSEQYGVLIEPLPAGSCKVVSFITE